ncbi:hypothetical protein TNCT_151951 [Trichonephila clavata]|uniref:Uncharacterized protein n=1 Tax=Trichonephila clavata TaxID=2740835 RepID=A0A8X6H5D9_TRICU|nr:hypothetical protein TNCT_151951 [Trichonephila clavata]
MAYKTRGTLYPFYFKDGIVGALNLCCVGERNLWGSAPKPLVWRLGLGPDVAPEGRWEGEENSLHSMRLKLRKLGDGALRHLFLNYD